MAKAVAPKPIQKPTPPAIKSSSTNAPLTGMTWSESLRKALQEKSGHKTGPEHDKSDWKGRQRSGLSMTHRNKFG
jgi:hypothetical protein